MAGLRFGFVTCVQIGLDVMEEIYAVGGSLDLAVTLEDTQARKKSGRVFIDSFCEKRDIPLVKTRSVNDTAAVDAIQSKQIDWLFIIGWSQIASKEVLAAPTRGCIGMHPTLLPEGRGRASVSWAILKALPETGVTMFQLDEGVDTGPILAQKRIPLTMETDATHLYDAVLLAHRQLIRENWKPLATDSLTLRAQDPESGSYWPGRTPEDGEVLPTMTVSEALRLVRATTHPYPGAFWRSPAGIVRVWSARTGSPTLGPAFECRDGIIEAVSFTMESEA